MRVVFDSNVVISAFLFGGPPARVLELAITGSVQAFTSLPILDEIRDVLQRPKFGLAPAESLSLIEELQQVCEIVNPTIPVENVLQDKDDHMILECALAAGADLIISGDAQLLELGRWQNIEILNPADAYARLSGRH
jgi:putative PIN family toxin of toxin-antitoxin system